MKDRPSTVRLGVVDTKTEDPPTYHVANGSLRVRDTTRELPDREILRSRPSVNGVAQHAGWGERDPARLTCPPRASSIGAELDDRVGAGKEIHRTHRTRCPERKAVAIRRSVFRLQESAGPKGSLQLRNPCLRRRGLFAPGIFHHPHAVAMHRSDVAFWCAQWIPMSLGAVIRVKGLPGEESLSSRGRRPEVRHFATACALCSRAPEPVQSLADQRSTVP